MAFTITITAEADSQLQYFAAREQRLIAAAIQVCLLLQPATTTKAVKRLRPNDVAELELRIGDFRVLYNVQGQEVLVVVVGRKVGNRLIVNGEEFHEHEDNTAEST